MHHNFVLKNKKRFYFILLLLSLLLTTPVFASTINDTKEPDYVSVCVKEGDNLWNLVSKYTENKDIRKYIYEVKKLNRMTDSTIYPGQTILLPLIDE